jgi:integrase
MLSRYSASEHKPAPRTKVAYERYLRQFGDFLKHRDATRVEDTDVLRYEQHMLESKLSHNTIENRFNGLKAIFNYARSKKLISNRPFEKYSFRAKPDPQDDVRGFTPDEQRKLLQMAREQNDPVIRWCTWLQWGSGLRIGEAADASTRDVEKIGDHWCLHIRWQNREGGSLKNRSSIRTVPIHPAVLEEGFLNYVQSLREGALFPSVELGGRYNNRADSITRSMGRFVRKTARITDPNISPNHSWRHAFETINRDLEIRTDVTNKLTGHIDPKSSIPAGYGEYVIATLAKAVERIPCPLG